MVPKPSVPAWLPPDPLFPPPPQALHVDDRVGPTWLCFLVVLALSAIFLISCVDFYEVMHEAPPAPPPASPPLGTLGGFLSS